MVSCAIFSLLTRHLLFFILDESVKEALAAELVPVIWWFFSVCHFDFFFSSLSLTSLLYLALSNNTRRPQTRRSLCFNVYYSYHLRSGFYTHTRNLTS